MMLHSLSNSFVLVSFATGGTPGAPSQGKCAATAEVESGALGVIYQEVVVHSIENWDAEVANKQHPRRPNGLPPSCPTDGSRSRGASQECDRGPAESARGGSRVQAQPAERCQVGQALPSGGSGWAEGPLLPSPPQPAPDAGRTGSPRRGVTPPPLARRPDRAGTEDRPGHREPHSAPVEPQPYPQHRAAAGGGSLRT